MTTLITTTCPVTGEPLKPGEAVSRTAVNQLTTIVSDLPSLMDDAQHTLAGLHHGNQEGPAGIPDSRPPLNLSTLEDLDPIRDTIDAWAASIAHHYTPGLHYHSGDWRMARQLIRHHADQLRRWEETPHLIDDLTLNIHALEKLISPQHTTREYAGPCPDCDTDVLVPPGTDTTTCRVCGAHIDVAQARQDMRLKLTWQRYPREKARACAEAVTGRPIPPATIRKWIQRGRLTETPQPAGPALVAVRDICDLIVGDTRSKWGA